MSDGKLHLSRNETVTILALIAAALAAGLPVFALTRALILLFALGGALYLAYHASWRLWKRRTLAIVCSVAYPVVVLILLDREARDAKTIAPTTVALQWLFTRVWAFPWIWILPTAALTVLIVLLSQRRQRVKQAAAAAANAKKVITLTAPMVDFHKECIETQHRLEEELSQLKTETAIALELAKVQLGRIGDFVEVVKACTHDAKLDDDLPTIRWGLLIQNHSVFRVELDGEVGPLFFEGRKLSQPKELQENTTRGLWPNGQGSLIFEQQLTIPEADMLRRRPDGLFQFDQVRLSFKGYKDERVKSGRVIIPSEFQATLGRCTDEELQAIAKVEKERDNLAAQITELKAPAGNLVINRAWYGVSGIHEEDVKGILAAMVKNNTLTRTDYYNDFLPDKVKTQRKQLFIEYLHNGIRFSVTLPENATATLPFPYRDPKRLLPPR